MPIQDNLSAGGNVEGVGTWKVVVKQDQLLIRFCKKCKMFY